MVLEVSSVHKWYLLLIFQGHMRASFVERSAGRVEAALRHALDALDAARRGTLQSEVSEVVDNLLLLTPALSSDSCTYLFLFLTS